MIFWNYGYAEESSIQFLHQHWVFVLGRQGGAETGGATYPGGAIPGQPESYPVGTTPGQTGTYPGITSPEQTGIGI